MLEATWISRDKSIYFRTPTLNHFPNLNKLYIARLALMLVLVVVDMRLGAGSKGSGEKRFFSAEEAF